MVLKENKKLIAGFKVDSIGECLTELMSVGVCGEGVPSEIELNFEEIHFTNNDDWAGLFGKKAESFDLTWSNGHIYSFTSNVVCAAFSGLPQQLLGLGALLWLPKLHFNWATFRLPHKWKDEHNYSAPGFADTLPVHGWACAFKGEGHNRLVSRRWLEWGPWRLIRDEAHDISFVQFHDLEADAATALEQAKPGHQRMGIYKLGGFLQTGYSYLHPPKGIYIEAERRLDIVITPGRVVDQVEMRDAAAARNLGHFAQPVDSICYIFYDEEQAREHLHEMWLRELQVYWINMEGEKVRLDDSYDPGQPVKPDWVLELERREA